MLDTLTQQIIGRNIPLFVNDINDRQIEIKKAIENGKFLVIGGAGSIGQSVVKEIFKRNPKKLHVVDINENNLVELVRDVRSSFGYINGDFETFAIDIGSIEYEAFIELDGRYDYVLNLSALKHVRSEKDEFTLMRMIDVNILNTIKTIEQSIEKGVKKYFCVSTDKAANPVNMMGASKRIMEQFLWRYADKINISTARFANVAYSDGSLLFGFEQRIDKRQPIVAPSDIERYFVTKQEAGELCLLSCLFGHSGETYFPKEKNDFYMIPLREIAIRHIKSAGFIPKICDTEVEARNYFESETNNEFWPCFFPKSDTTGEKTYEEFYTKNEEVQFNQYDGIGVIKNKTNKSKEDLNRFLVNIHALRNSKKWSKSDLIKEFKMVLPNFEHFEKGKFLENKM